MNSETQWYATYQYEELLVWYIVWSAFMCQHMGRTNFEKIQSGFWPTLYIYHFWCLSETSPQVRPFGRVWCMSHKL